jgi:hypothetical protein
MRPRRNCLDRLYCCQFGGWACTPSAHKKSIMLRVACVANVTSERASRRKSGFPSLECPDGREEHEWDPQVNREYLERWAIPLIVPADGAKVLVVKFNDCQCPACGQSCLQPSRVSTLGRHRRGRRSNREGSRRSSSSAASASRQFPGVGDLPAANRPNLGSLDGRDSGRTVSLPVVDDGRYHRVHHEGHRGSGQQNPHLEVWRNSGRAGWRSRKGSSRRKIANR